MFNDLENLESFDALPTRGNDQQFPCEKCGGKGKVTFGYVNVREGKCFKCNGTGSFKTSPEHRAKAKDNRAVAAIKKAASNWAVFAESYPAEADYLKKNWHKSDFLRSLQQQVEKRGSLSDKQRQCILNQIAKDNAPAKAAPKAAAVVDLSPVFAKFETARSAGLKRPKLRLDGFCFSLAGGRNAGSIYVKNGPAYEDGYLGKVSPNGEFFKSRDCSAEEVEGLKAISQDVMAAAKAYGQKTGNCSCCGRELTKEDSIAAGIGPICAEKWGM